MDAKELEQLEDNFPVRLQLENWEHFTYPSGWAVCHLQIDDIDRMKHVHYGVVNWIHDNIKDPYTNARWSRVANVLKVWLPSTEHYVMFIMRWGSENHGKNL